MTQGAIASTSPRNVDELKAPRKMDDILVLPALDQQTLIPLAPLLHTALQDALTKLGYTTYHSAESILDSKNDALLNWHEAIRAKYHGQGRPYEGKDFEKMLWRYNVRYEILPQTKAR
ncbi:MAG: hypothetical protein Q9198_005469 [Flavoplaca austrocitrina]